MRFKTAILISVALHLYLFVGFLYLEFRRADRAAGDKEFVIAVDLVGDGQGDARDNTFIADRKNTDADPELRLRSKSRSSSRLGSDAGPESGSGLGGSGTGLGAAMSSGTPGDGGSNTTLSKIRRRIEAAKEYPRIARKLKIEGRPTVIFEIGPNGEIKTVSLVTSSGQKIIDDAAIETVRRAAPLPYYEGPIQLAIRYNLE